MQGPEDVRLDKSGRRLNLAHIQGHGTDSDGLLEPLPLSGYGHFLPDKDGGGQGEIGPGLVPGRQVHHNAVHPVADNRGDHSDLAPGSTVHHVVAVPIGNRPQAGLRHEDVDVGQAFAVGAVTDEAADGAGLSLGRNPAQG